MAEVWYNSYPHSSTGKSPLLVGITTENDIAAPELSDWL